MSGNVLVSLTSMGNVEKCVKDVSRRWGKTAFMCVCVCGCVWVGVWVCVLLFLFMWTINVLNVREKEYHVCLP